MDRAAKPTDDADRGGDRMTTYQLRPYQAEDLPQVAALENRWRDEPIQLDDWRVRIAQREARGSYRRLVAVVPNGQIIATGWTGRSFTRKGFFDLSVVVDATWERRGIGNEIYQALEAFAQAEGAQALEGALRDDQPTWRAFAERRGFVVTHQFFRSELDLSRFDPTPFLPAVKRAEAAGYRFARMSDLPVEEAQRAYYEIECENVQDEPDWDENWENPPFELFRAQNFGRNHDPAGVFFALKDGVYAGVSALHAMVDGAMSTAYTGVRRAHRGAGLAQALKILSTQHAMAAGARTISTHNHSGNRPMLAINRKFGFKPFPGLYVVRKRL
jgi:GNAT superfamily N-acetyltransferase